MAIKSSDYEIDYNDQRLTGIKSNESDALDKHEQLYDGLSEDIVNQYSSAADEVKKNAEEQKKLLQEQGELAIDKIEQEKAQAKKDYTKEQSGAYVDYKKQSNRYGANAEQMAAGGFTGSGYSESSQVSMYNQYQNRIAIAREALVIANSKYDIAMAEAKIQNDIAIAEIVAEANQKALEYIIQGTLQKTTLLKEKATQELAIKSFYSTEYKNMLDQINREKAFEAEIAQFNEEQAYREAQLALQREQFNYQKAQDTAASIKKASGNNGSKGSTANESTKKVNAAKQKSRESVKVSSYTQAVKVLEQAGIKGDGGLMTDDEWERRKTSGSNRAEFGYATYVDYLNNFVAWRLKNPE